MQHFSNTYCFNFAVPHQCILSETLSLKRVGHGLSSQCCGLSLFTIRDSWELHTLVIFHYIFNVSIYWACKSSLVLLLIQNHLVSKQKQGKECCFAVLVNWRRVPFFFSKLWLVIFFLIMAHLIYKKNYRTGPQRPAVQNAWYDAVAICSEKNFHASLKVWKKHSLLINLSKFLQIICHHVCVFFKFFFRVMRIIYALRAELCDFPSVHNSGSPDLCRAYRKYGNAFKR